MNKSLAIGGVVIKELYRRKDFYVLLVLTALITGLLGTVNFFNDPKIVRYLKEVCLLLIWISSLVIAITTAARQIPAERENRTIFPLLAKPVTRWHLIFGKFLGCWLACGLALVMFYAFFAVVSESRGRETPTATQAAQLAAPAAHEDHDDHDGHDHMSHESHAASTNETPAAHEAHEDHDGHDHHADHAPAKPSPWLSYLQALWLHWMMLGVVTALVLLGSVVFTAPSSNTTISFIGVLGILLLGEHLHKVALRLAEPSQTLLSILYFVMPHLEWYDIRDRVIYDLPPIAWSACGLASLYALAYAGLFLGAAWFVFRRKALNT